jgi:hypothetical protein
MTLTKQTIMTWTSTEAKNMPAELITERTAFVTGMYDQGKTNGPPVELDALKTQRLWTDQAAAEEWVAWIQDAKVRLNLGLVSVEIYNYTAP